MNRLFLAAFAASALGISAATAEPLRLAQAAAVAPGGEPAKPAPKAKPKPKPAASAASTGARKDADYRKTLEEPRRLRREDLEDDPQGTSESRFRPSITPDGRPALGGRF